MKHTQTPEEKKSERNSLKSISVVSSNSGKRKNNSEADNKYLLEAVIHTEERERKRMADYLNEELGSMLSAVKLKFGLLENDLLQLPAKSKEEFEEAIKMLDDAIYHLRNVAHESMPVTLEFGLFSAIQSLTDRINHSGLLKVNLFYTSQNFELKNKSLEITVYRIIQELLNNAIYHSKAKETNIHFSLLSHSLLIKVTDDGIGFNYQHEKDNSNGLGLKKIDQRIQVFGGIMEVHSTAKTGTSVSIELPLN